VQFKLPMGNPGSIFGAYGQIKKNLSSIKAIHMKLPEFVIPVLASSPYVAYITPDRRTTGSLDVTNGSVYADLAWQYGYTRTGVGVAVVDSGVALRDDLKNSSGTASRVVYSESFVAGTTAADQYGHGTHVAGIIGSNGARSLGTGFLHTFKGVAPNV